MYITLFPFRFLSHSVDSEYKVSVSSVSEFVNQGDDYVIYFTIPGVGASDIMKNLKVQWVHNDKQLTNICNFIIVTSSVSTPVG